MDPPDGCSSCYSGRLPPHTRGWTPRHNGMRPFDGGFPAHAGMDREASSQSSTRYGLPRTRGDGPWLTRVSVTPPPASPHTRGWTLRAARPRDAGVGFPRTRGDGPDRKGGDPEEWPASPHTRGWTQGCGQGVSHGMGFPAHAGMDPRP